MRGEECRAETEGEGYVNLLRSPFPLKSCEVTEEGIDGVLSWLPRQSYIEADERYSGTHASFVWVYSAPERW